MPTTPGSRRRAHAVATVLGIGLVAAACSGSDDTPATSAGSTGSVVAPTGPPPTTAAPVAATAPPLTQPVVPTLDDTAEVGGTRLYTVDLATGAATSVGPIGGAEVGVLGLTFVPGPRSTTVYGLTDGAELVTFDVTDPGTLLTTTPITGVADGSTLLAIDVSPLDGRLLALSDASVLYSIDPPTGAATAIGDGLAEPVGDPGFGFDVDPATGLVVVQVATGQHLLIDPVTGELAGADDPPADGAPRVVAVAAFHDRLYAIDVATGSLTVQAASGGGEPTTVGPLGVDVTDGASFDVSPSGRALLASPG